ncbi:hypothetical protein ACFL2M_01510 [Patescibacteria group bacterium]
MLPISEILLFLFSIGLVVLWLNFPKCSQQFQRILFFFTIVFSFLVTFHAAHWILIEIIPVSPLTWLSISISVSVVFLGRLKNWVGPRQWRFYIFATLFPVLFVTLLVQQLFLGDLFLNIILFLAFFISGFSLIKDQKFRLPTWVGYCSVALLCLFRVFNGGQYGLRDTENVDITMIFIITAMISGFIVYSGRIIIKKLELKEFKAPRWVDGAVLLFLLFCTFILTTTNLSGMSFQNDEFYHVEATMGYIETGTPVQWDFVNDQPQVDDDGKELEYTRAFPYTWQVIQSTNIFGLSESASRLPSVIWFALFIVMSYLVIRHWSKNIVFTTLLVLTFICFDHFIFHSRIVRMYSMLLFFANAAMVLWYIAYQMTLRKTIVWKRFIPTLLGAILASVIAFFTHKIFLIFFPAFLLFLGLELIRSYSDSKTSIVEKKRTALWVGAGLFGALTTLIVGLWIYPFIQLDFIGLRNSPNFDYQIIPFSDLPLIVLGVGLYLVGCASFIRQSASARFMAVISLAVILFFVFFVKRYDTMRYILFMIPFILTVGGYTLFSGIDTLGKKIKSEKVRAATAAVIFIVLFVPLSWPGVQAGGLLQEARADRTHENGYGHNFRQAYQYIKDNRTSDEVVLTQSFRSLYWGKDNVEIVDLGKDKVLTRNQLKKLMKQYKKGWIVWADGKSHHLSKRVRQYIERNTENISEIEPQLEGSNMQVYYFNWKEIQAATSS